MKRVAQITFIVSITVLLASFVCLTASDFESKTFGIIFGISLPVFFCGAVPFALSQEDK